MPTDSNNTTRFAVILFTDMVDSVEMQDRASTPAYSKLIRQHDWLFSEALAPYSRDPLTSDTGDGHMAVFSKPSDAVEAALRFQALLRHEPWQDDPPEVRMGLHQGQITVNGSSSDSPQKCVGMPVNVAARIMGLAQGGQILMTRPTFDDAKCYVDNHPIVDGVSDVPEIDWRSHGLFLLKGIESPMEVFEVGAVGHAPFSTPPDSDKATKVIGWQGAGTEILLEIFRAVAELAPLLHKMGEPMNRDETRKFLCAMQCFFVGGNQLTVGFDRDLCIGTDNLLRVLSNVKDAPAYLFGKLGTASRSFEAYRLRKSVGHEVDVRGESVADACRELHRALHLMRNEDRKVSLPDNRLLRLSVALAEYGSSQRPKRNPYPPLPLSLHQALREFLGAAITMNFHTQLPDPLESFALRDLKSSCRMAWEEFPAQ